MPKPASHTKTNFLHKIEAYPLGKLWVFAIRQGWAALFGGLMLWAILFTTYFPLPWLHQYDWLFIAAIIIQIGMIATKLEQPREVIIIICFHLVGLGMELFKTSSTIGSWSYPGEAVIRLGNVPLFSGFMYAAVGSYMARSWRVMHLRFNSYPSPVLTIVLAGLIYLNFFTHHYIFDFRYLLFGGVALLYWRTRVRYVLARTAHSMPLVVGFGLIALFIWVAENVGTFTKTWLYPNQMTGWHMVSLNKLGSWLLLMIISFVMVDILHRYFKVSNK